MGRNMAARRAGTFGPSLSKSREWACVVKIHYPSINPYRLPTSVATRRRRKCPCADVWPRRRRSTGQSLQSVSSLRRAWASVSSVGLRTNSRAEVSRAQDLDREVGVDLANDLDSVAIDQVRILSP